jgi:hypothetical protein
MNILTYVTMKTTGCFAKRTAFSVHSHTSMRNFNRLSICCKKITMNFYTFYEKMMLIGHF